EMAAHRLAGVLGLGLAGAELDGGVAVLFLGAHGDDLAAGELQDGHRDMAAVFLEDAGHAHLLRDDAGTHHFSSFNLMSTWTPAARSSLPSASTVWGVGSTMSSRRLWVRISNCSRAFLSICGERLTVNLSIRVGSGIGPRTCAPVRLAVLTISRVEVSSTRWSNALRRMRIF